MVMNFFPSRHRCCSECSQRRVKVKGEEVMEYYHRAVVFHLVGFKIAMPLDIEMIRPGEGEVSAAKRLLQRALTRYGRFFDVVLTDAIYLEAPFFNLCLTHRKDVISVLKGDQRLLLQDAHGVFSLINPKDWKEGQTQIRAWDEEGLTTLEGIQASLRVLHTEETITKRQRKNHQWIEVKEIHHWWWVTTVSISQIPTKLLWYIAHRRWEIENNLFHTLVTHWSLNHCFKHHPMAILNFILTLFIAFILLQSFYYGNLKPQRRTHLTLIGLAKELHLSLVLMEISAPWISFRGG